MSQVSSHWTSDVWLNGNIVEPRLATASVMSHGLHYGTGVFEGIRFYGGQPFQQKAHMSRFLRSAKHLGFNIPYSVEELSDAANAIIERSGIFDGYIRAVSWLDDSSLGLQAKGLRVDTAIIVWSWDQVFQSANGISLMQGSAARPGPEILPPQAKATGGYLIGFLAHNSAKRSGYDDCLLLDHEGFIAETSSANFFAVLDGKLITPKADRFLNGITRQIVLEIAAHQKMEFEERRISITEISSFQEAFVCGTAVEICPVTQINKHEMNIGSTTGRLRSAYRKRTILQNEN